MLPKVITLATSKGGAGKSTLVRSIACHFLQSGFKVAVIDADPQGSVIKRNTQEGILKNLHLVAEPEESVSEVIEELKKDYYPIIVDTGGFRNRTTIKALINSDLAIIPLKPSADDLTAAVETYSLISELNQTSERLGNPILYRMILTMSQYGTIISRHIRSELESMGYFVLNSEMFLRVAYPEAAIKGLSPCITEPDGAAARDIAAIMTEISNLKL
ncbi:CobQ/CobB/MinD/ParA nucleotide binding domain protein [Candidatus Arcanobacter lacustris]|uniref:CobQ/CobB/MinD/ParA nucleotide binding domain protein n=1 Tax=Candidatus Arcanibacter lacustris TaxID=1607817 RepID=A0A0F5MNU2_9RICK|nr:CobQ/CobB/MinD/ParA nucleotide binding domain protein [Candidatus Arcanobacter lacustris]